MGGASGMLVARGGDHYKTLDNNVNQRWLHDPGLRLLNFGIATMFASSAANGYDGSLINGLLAIPYFNSNIGKINVNILGLALAGISLGGLPSFIPASYVCDYFGRRVTVAIGSSTMIAAAAIQCATSGPYAFLGTRIMLGIGLGFSQTGAPPLTTEIAHPRHRSNVTNLFLTIWFWGSIVSACVTLSTLFLDSTWSWRIPCLLQALFPSIQLLGLLFVPESPRWLVSKDRHQEALQILARYHANGKLDDPLVQFEFREICQAIQAEKEAARATDWSTFFATSGNRRRLLICILVGVMTQWAGNGIVSYYLVPILRSVGIADPITQAGINLALQVWNACLATAGALAAERVGRRPMWLLSTSGMLVAFTMVTILSAVFKELKVEAAGAATVAFLFVFYGFYVIAFTPLAIAYPVEILPFRLRAKGLSLNLTANFAAGFFNQYVNPVAMDAIAWRFYTVYIVLLACMLPIIWFLFPETKGRTLEEIAVVFDGEPTATVAVVQPHASFRRLDVPTGHLQDNKGAKELIEDITHDIEKRS